MNEQRALRGGVAASPAEVAPVRRRPRVIAVNRFYWPDQSATSQLLTDLAEHLVEAGWPEVTVISSRMHYDGMAERLAPSGHRRRVRIRRVWTSAMGQRRLAGRMLDYLTFYLSALVALLVEARRGDVIVATTDPPLLAVPARLAAAIRGARLVTWNHDLFPEVAGALGMRWASGALAAGLPWLRNRALRAAADNVAISTAMAQRIQGALGDPGRVATIRNWSSAGIRPIAAADNPLRRDWGLGDAFVIGYSGNLGRAHIPERIAELVRRTHDIPGLAWLFIGSGSGLDRIRSAVAGIRDATGAGGNIHFRPYHPREDLARSLSVPDLHLVSLDPSCEGMIFPSKLYGIEAAGRPTVFLGRPDGELARDLAVARTGVTLDLARPEGWRATIEALMADRAACVAMGARARARAWRRDPKPELMLWAAVLEQAVHKPRQSLLVRYG